MTGVVIAYPVVLSLIGWMITSALFFAVDVLARKNLATGWLRLILLGVFLLCTAFWVLVAVLSIHPVPPVRPLPS
jgi:hypothetical protein